MSLSLGVVAFFRPRAFLACERKRRSSFAHKREEQLPQKRPAIDLDVLPGDEARAGTAEEAHGRGDVGGVGRRGRRVARAGPPAPARANDAEAPAAPLGAAPPSTPASPC